MGLQEPYLKKKKTFLTITCHKHFGVILQKTLRFYFFELVNSLKIISTFIIPLFHSFLPPFSFY